MMRSPMSLTAVLLTTLAAASSAAPAAKPAAAASMPAGRGAAATACERAAQDTLRDTRGAAVSASFDAAPSVVPGAADALEVTLRGAGHARAPSGTWRFSYSCTYDSRAGTVAGMVVRDAAPAERAAAVRAAEPDLSLISPAACESAAAGALKRRWPGVAHIIFNNDTRQLSQQSGSSASLRGQGTATPTLQDPATHFGYDCAIDPRSGRVIGLRLVD